MKKTGRKTTPATSVVSRRELKNCWILEGDKYAHADEMHVGRLPYVELRDEIVLQENQIPYAKANRLGKEVLEYWSPECEEKEEVEAPLYVKVFGKYEYMGKKHTGQKPTRKMIEMANAMTESVSKMVHDHREENWRQKLYQEAKRALDGGLARYKDVKHNGYFKYHDLQEGNNHIKCFPVVDARGNYLKGVVFFDVGKIARGSIVNLKVPEEMMGWIKGKKGGKIRAWAKEIEVEEIKLTQ